MSAERLRKVAADMREKAEAALSAVHDPWKQDGTGWTHADGGGISYEVVHADTSRERYVVSESPFEEVSLYQAAWHPAVALAVANLLEGVAGDIDHGWAGHTDVERALAVCDAWEGKR